MWYYKTSKTLKGFFRILIYIFLNFVQKNNLRLYTKYSLLGESNYLEFYFLSKSNLCNNISHKNCDCLILIEKYKHTLLLKNIFRINRIRIVDIDFFGHLGLNMLINVGFFDFSDKEKRIQFKKKSMSNFINLKLNFKHKEVFVLGNNQKFSYEIKKIMNKPVFICNDSVRIINQINSESIVLAFADPMFHFSIHPKAKEYLNTVKKYEKFIEYLIVPINTLPILDKLNLNIKVIGLTSSNRISNFIEIKNNNLITKKTHNVLTQFMLPVAISVSQNINLGAVTLDKLSKQILWSYDKKLVNKNEKFYAFNYSFFRDRSFKNYYKKHHKYLKKLLKLNNKIKIL